MRQEAGDIQLCGEQLLLQRRQQRPLQLRGDDGQQLIDESPGRSRSGVPMVAVPDQILAPNLFHVLFRVLALFLSLAVGP